MTFSGADSPVEEEDELDRIVNSSATGGSQREIPGIVRVNDPPPTVSTQDQLFEKAMSAITSMAENISAGSNNNDKFDKVLSLLVETQKRKREDELAEEEPVLTDEMIHVKDDGNTVIDMMIRQKLKNPNCEPHEWWIPSVMDKVTRPVIGMNTQLGHLMPGRVNPISIRKLHDRSVLVTAKALSTHNSGVTGEKKMIYKLHNTEDEDTVLMGSKNYQDNKTVSDLVESMLNMTAVLHQVRPYSYEGLAILRCMHHIR